MPVRVPADRLGPSGRRDRLAPVGVLEMITDHLPHLPGLAVGRQVHAVLEELGQAVLGQVIGHQHRPARQGLEDPHVDVVADAAVEDDPAGRVDPRHVVEKKPGR